MLHEPGGFADWIDNQRERPFAFHNDRESAILAAVGAFRAAGAMDALARLIGPVTSRLGLPPEVVPMAIVMLALSPAHDVFAQGNAAHRDPCLR